MSLPDGRLQARPEGIGRWGHACEAVVAGRVEALHRSPGARVARGMPCRADLPALLPRWPPPAAAWQGTLTGRAEVWPVHRRTAELGGLLRTGLEDCF